MPPDVATAVAAGCAGWLTWLALRWLGVGRTRRRAARLARDIERGLPFVFDMMVLCVEAGMSVQGALQLAARSGPPGLLRDALDRALVEMRAGVPQAVAIRLLARRSGSTLAAHWAVAMAQAEALGASLAGAAHAGRSRPRRQADPAEQMAFAGAGENVVAADRLHFSLHLHRAGLSCRGAAVVEPALTRRAPPMARLRLLRVDGWWADAGLAWRKPRARGWASCSRRVSRCIPSACAIP